MSSQIFSTLSVILLVLGCPEHSSSSTNTPQLIPMVSVSSWIVWRQFLWTSSPIFSALSVVLLVLGHPEHSSSSTDTRP
jgi:hypothetical protein